jgi:hypothetical protein
VTRPRLLLLSALSLLALALYRLLIDGEPGPYLTYKDVWLMAMDCDRPDWVEIKGRVS